MGRIFNGGVNFPFPQGGKIPRKKKAKDKVLGGITNTGPKEKGNTWRE